MSDDDGPEEPTQDDAPKMAEPPTEASEPPVVIESVEELPPTIESFSALSEQMLAELKDSAGDPTAHVRMLATCIRQADDLPTAEHAERLPALLKEATLALMRHKELPGRLPLLVNAFVLEVVEYCVRMIPRDCLPLAELMAECFDYKKPLYREHGGGGGDAEEDDGDTTAWRMSLDFADRVDALKTNWDKTRAWSTAQIIEVNSTQTMVKVHYDTGKRVPEQPSEPRAPCAELL